MIYKLNIIIFFLLILYFFYILYIFIKGICVKHNLLINFNLIDFVQISNIRNHVMLL